MKDILIYEKFCQQRWLDQTRPESLGKYNLYREAVEVMEFDLLTGFISQEH